MLESKLEARLTRLLRAKGCIPLKFVSPGQAGVPDRIVLIPGGPSHPPETVFVEMKAPGEKERPLQARVHDALRAAGYTVFSSVDSAQRIDDVVAYCQASREMRREKDGEKDGQAARGLHSRHTDP